MLLLVLAAVTSVLAVARLTRLLIEDDFPPAVWLRERYQSSVPHQWAGLAACPFCLAPWLQLGSLSWAWASGLSHLWWFVHLWLALSYLAAMVVVRDQPLVFDEEDDDG